MSSATSIADAKARALEIAQRLASKLGTTAGHSGDGQSATSSVLGKRGRDEEAPRDRKQRRILVPVAEHPDMNFLGLLIGPRGATQKSLEQQSGARILLRGAGASRDVDDSNEPMHVLILGDTDEQIDTAERLVHELLHNPERMMEIKSQQLKTVAQLQGVAASESAPPTSLSLGSKESKSHELRVGNDKVGLVIGRAGETIRSLESLTGAQIQIAKEVPGSRERVVTVVGTDDSITRAIEEISRIVSGSGGTSGSRIGGMSGYGNEVEKLPIPNNLVGLLIGRSGETVRALQSRSGCLINIQRESDMDPSSPTREVTLTGSREQVDMARREIEAITNGQSATETGGRRVIVNLRVPNACVGTIIGKGGETIRRVQQATGAKIQLDRNDTGKAERELTIIGDSEQVERARTEVEELIREKQQGGGGGGHGGPGYPRYSTSGAPPTSADAAYGVPPYGVAPGYGYPPAYPPHDYYPPAGDYYGGHYQQPGHPQQGYGGADYYQQQTLRQGGLKDGSTSSRSSPQLQREQKSSPIASTNSNATAAAPQSGSGEVAATGSVTLPTPPQDEAAFTVYWAGLSYDQQQEYYRLYYPEMLSQLTGQQPQ